MRELDKLTRRAEALRTWTYQVHDPISLSRPSQDIHPVILDEASADILALIERVREAEHENAELRKALACWEARSERADREAALGDED